MFGYTKLHNKTIDLSRLIREGITFDVLSKHTFSQHFICFDVSVSSFE